MINTDSRYYDGTILKALDAKTEKTYPTVFRKFPNVAASFSNYTWEEGDRIDTIQQENPDPRFWEKVLDANPEIANPNAIAPGTIIRIPNFFNV